MISFCAIFNTTDSCQIFLLPEFNSPEEIQVGPLELDLTLFVFFKFLKLLTFILYSNFAMTRHRT